LTPVTFFNILRAIFEVKAFFPFRRKGCCSAERDFQLESRGNPALWAAFFTEAG
jgi:hypothetical protein